MVWCSCSYVLVYEHGKAPLVFVAVLLRVFVPLFALSTRVHCAPKCTTTPPMTTTPSNRDVHVRT